MFVSLLFCIKSPCCGITVVSNTECILHSPMSVSMVWVGWFSPKSYPMWSNAHESLGASECATWTRIIERFIVFTLEQMEAARVNDRQKENRFHYSFWINIVLGKIQWFQFVLITEKTFLIRGNVKKVAFPPNSCSPTICYWKKVCN